MLSDIGGVLGLSMGCSVISMIEFVYLIGLVFAKMLNVIKNRALNWVVWSFDSVKEFCWSLNGVWLSFFSHHSVSVTQRLVNSVVALIEVNK